MALDKTRLREQIVFLEMADALHVDVDPLGYLKVARDVRRTMERELGALPIQAFVSSVLPTLQTTAENIFFEGHRQLPDLDGSGRAGRARTIANRLLRRVSRP